MTKDQKRKHRERVAKYRAKPENKKRELQCRLIRYRNRSLSQIKKDRLKNLDYNQRPTVKKRQRVYNRERYQRKGWSQFWAAKERARNKGIEFTITVRDILNVWPDDEICPVLGVCMVRGTEDAPSLDRVLNDVGYVPANIRIISLRANNIKSTGTAAEHRAIADWIDRESG